jgi:PTS system nitrogen regulatory IIA component
MRLSNALRPECIAAGLKLAKKNDALREVARLAKASDVLAGVPAEAILKGLQQRESLGSTGFGGGIAIPHCRLDSAPDFVVGLLTVPDGVNFDALDRQKVRLMAFIIAPLRESNEHIRVLSGISQVLSSHEIADQLIAAGSAEELREIFLRNVQEEAEAEPGEGFSLFHVLVENENLFHEILQVFGAVQSCSALVVSAERTGVYLSRIPLFADLWNDSSSSYGQLIVALVNKRLTNEAIRRIEKVTGPLKDRTDVVVAVQDLMYCAGSLQT